MRRVLKIVAIVVIAIPVLLVAVLGGGLLWANSGSGRSAIARMAGDFVPGLTIEGLRGPLPGRIGIARLTMADAEGIWLEVENAELDLDLRALLHRAVHLSLDGQRIAVHRAPVSAPTEPAPPAQPGFAMPQLPQLPVSIRLERLALARVELGAPLAGVAAAFRLDASGRYDAAGVGAQAALVRLDGPGEARLDLDLAPADNRLHADITLAEPAGGVIGPLVGLPGAATAAHLTLEGPASGAALSLQASVGGASVTAKGTVGLTPEGGATVALDGQAIPQPFLPETLRAAAEKLGFSVAAMLAPDRAVTLRQLRLEAPVGTVGASGTLDAAGAMALQVTAALGASQPLAALLPPGIGWDTATLEATISGRTDAPVIAATLLPTGLRLPDPAPALLGPAPRIDFAGALPGRIDRLVVAGREIDLDAAGTVLPALDARATIRLKRLAVLAPQVEGALAADIRARGTIESPTIELVATTDGLTAAGRRIGATRVTANATGLPAAPAGSIALTSVVEGMPLSLEGKGSWTGTEALLDTLDAKLGEAVLHGTGRYTPGAPLPLGKIQLAVPDLAPFARLAGQAIAGAIKLDAETTAERITARLEVPRITVAGTTGSGLLTAQGQPEDFDIVLNGQARLPDGRQARLETRAGITAEAAGRRIDLASLDLSADPLGVRLAAPARITLGNDGAVATPGLVLNLRPGGVLRASGRYAGGPITGQLALSNLSLATYSALFSPTPLRGTADLQAKVSGTAEQPRVEATLTASGLATDTPLAKDLPTGTLRAEALLAGQALRGTADLRLGDTGRVEATVELPRGFAPDSPLQGRANATADVTALARRLLAGTADQITGRLRLDLQASGTVGAPVLAGQTEFSNGSWRNPLYGIRLTNIGARASATGNRVTIDSLQATTPGNGSITGNGSIDAGAEGMPGEIRITARNAQPLAGDMGKLTADADITVSGPLAGGATIGGEVRIRRGEFGLPEGLGGNVPTIEVRRRGEAVRPAARPAIPAPPYRLALRVVAPQAIFLRWRGLDAEMGGTINVGGTAQAPDITGGLRLRRGQFDLADRRLNFTRGALSFPGGVIPDLDFLVSSRVESTTVNITVTGPATKPEIAFSSTPELPQDEVLALLLFRRSTSKLSPLELAQLARGLAGLTGALPGNGEAGFMARIGRSLGLDRLGLGESTSTGNNGGDAASALPSLEAGRYIGQGVYVGVQQGAEAGSTRVGVQIELTPRLKLETATGTDSGERLGLSYEFEY